MTSPRRQLRDKLVRELFQTEHSACVHAAREARRLGDVPPGQALLAIAEHAMAVRPRLEAVTEPRGSVVGVAVGALLSAVRHFVIDRVTESERSYRATLLGLKHGIDVMRLLREVAWRDHDHALARWCEDTLVERESLLDQAELALAFFAEEPEIAVHASTQARALQPDAR